MIPTMNAESVGIELYMCIKFTKQNHIIDKIGKRKHSFADLAFVTSEIELMSVYSIPLQWSIQKMGYSGRNQTWIIKAAFTWYI